jgi:hypothetical protein
MAAPASPRKPSDSSRRSQIPSASRARWVPRAALPRAHPVLHAFLEGAPRCGGWRRWFSARPMSEIMDARISELGLGLDPAADSVDARNARRMRGVIADNGSREQPDFEVRKTSRPG